MSASSKACLVRFASWWIKWARGCGEHGRCIRLWPSALESHACKPCTWPKDQPPTNPKAAQAAARRRFDWLLLPRCDGVRGMAAYRGLEKNGYSKPELRSDATLQQLLGLAAMRLSCSSGAVRCSAIPLAQLAQPANKIACLGSGYFQAYRKSRLPGQVSRRVEKTPACGRFGFGASVLQAAS